MAKVAKNGRKVKAIALLFCGRGRGEEGRGTGGGEERERRG